MRKFSSLAVLVVDDSSTMRKLICGMLQHLSVRSITEASDGTAAIKEIAASSFDLIISDWHMGPMDGLELLKRARKISRAGTNRFIFVTSETSWGSRTTAKLEGAQAFISKPFMIEALKATMKTVLA